MIKKFDYFRIQTSASNSWRMTKNDERSAGSNEGHLLLAIADIIDSFA
jgi:hypothetical protein